MQTRGYAWRKLRAEVLKTATHCGICGLPLTNAPARTPWATEVDHIVPIGVGGDPLPPIQQLRACHKRCNVKLGNRMVKKRRPARPSRNW